MLDSDGKYNILCWVRAGPWHKRNSQMLVVLLIPRGAKKICIIIIIYCIFLLPILLQYYEFKIFKKVIVPRKKLFYCFYCNILCKINFKYASFSVQFVITFHNVRKGYSLVEHCCNLLKTEHLKCILKIAYGPRNTRGPPCSQRCFNFSFIFEFCLRL